MFSYVACACSVLACAVGTTCGLEIIRFLSPECVAQGPAYCRVLQVSHENFVYCGPVKQELPLRAITALKEWGKK